MKRILSFLLFAFCSLTVLAQVDTAQQIVADRSNSTEQQDKPYVILISADGFRYDYAEKYKAEHLLALANGGVKAESMVPSFPSVTFPNHYTIVTGLYPSHHGLVDNSFYDRSLKRFYSYKGKTASEGIWYGGTPLWVLAEQQKMVTASYFWVGSEADIKNTYPTYYYKYNQVTPIDKRIATVVDWLKLPAEKRPHLITFYFPQVDHEAHKHGPNSPEVEQAVHFVDSAVYELTKAVDKTRLKVNYIFVSDHGMTTPDIVNTLKLPAAIDTSKYIIGDHGLMIDLYAKNPDDIQKTYEQLKKEAKDYQVYLRVNIPRHYHYSKSDDRYGRIGDIILISDFPKVFNIHNYKLDPGWHGFDPDVVKDMHATFYAWGPAFKTNTQIGSFPNVDIFPLVAEILGLKYTFKVDGTKHLANVVLKK
ncbi:MAG TPA: ectonucleotide pyrophosphatase/phosphodiesterase [Mucilaginibacter sp.]